jgi:hypothetical protein
VSNKITQVALLKAGGQNIISLEQFLAYPIKERIDLIIANKVEFLSASGDTIPVLDAMELMKQS